MTDERYEELSCPQPTFVVRSLANDPDYIKCPRCWHYTHEGLHNYDNLCDRCCSNMVEGWPDHPAIPHILESRKKQLEYFSAEAVQARRKHD